VHDVRQWPRPRRLDRSDDIDEHRKAQIALRCERFLAFPRAILIFRNHSSPVSNPFIAAAMPRARLDSSSGLLMACRRPLAVLFTMEMPMALGLCTNGNSGGQIKPYVTLDAKAGRMFRIDRSPQGDGTWATDKVEITNTAQMVMDLANIRVGYINFTAQGPVRRLVVLGKEPIPPRPDDKTADGKPAFKQAFEVDLVLDTASGGGTRVFSSAAGCVIEAMDALHDAYSAAPEAKAGKLPIVKIAGVQPTKSGQSYKPTFAIVGWIDRPASLTAAPASASKTASATGSTQVKAPAPQPDSAGDFG
jgi:hypothetical protein